jgi:hypothetical protein
MGIFDIFKKKTNGQDPQNTSSHITNPERATIVPIDKVTEGSHGDHWGALLGFEQFYNNQQSVMEMLALVRYQGVKTQIDAEHFNQEISKQDFSLKTVSSEKELITAFPVVKSGISIETKTKVIKEWQHANRLEAQIEAQGKNTFGLSYFATDYAENKNLYQSKFNLNIRLSGFAYSVAAPPHSENMAPDFVGYMPNSEHGKFSVLDYVGKILELKEINDDEFGIKGYIASLRLIQMDNDSDFFVVETFISKGNMELPGIAVGDRISGSMWLQGQIA